MRLSHRGELDLFEAVNGSRGKTSFHLSSFAIPDMTWMLSGVTPATCTRSKRGFVATIYIQSISLQFFQRVTIELPALFVVPCKEFHKLHALYKKEKKLMPCGLANLLYQQSFTRVHILQGRVCLCCSSWGWKNGWEGALQTFFQRKLHHDSLNVSPQTVRPSTASGLQACLWSCVF